MLLLATTLKEKENLAETSDSPIEVPSSLPLPSDWLLAPLMHLDQDSAPVLFQALLWFIHKMLPSYLHLHTANGKIEQEISNVTASTCQQLLSVLLRFLAAGGSLLISECPHSLARLTEICTTL